MSIILYIIPLIISFYIGWYFSKQKKKHYKKREEVKANGEYLTTIRMKPTEMLRHAFAKIFLILFLLSLGIFIPVFFKFVEFNQKLVTPIELINFIQFLILLSAVAAAFWTFRTFNDVVHYEDAIKKNKKELDKLDEKIKHS